MREQQNVPSLRPAEIFIPQASCPIPSGEIGLWADLVDGVIKYRNADGSDSIGNSEGSAVILLSKYVAAGALPANTYANGVAGVGATLTKNSNGTLGTIDGQTPDVGDVFLVTGEVVQSHNGLYEVTVKGNGSTPYVITRWIAFNTSDKMLDGTNFAIQTGTTYADTGWRYISPSNPVVGTDPLLFAFAPSIGLATTAPANVDGAAAAIGVGSTAARADHKHSLPAAVAPLDVDSSPAAPGVSINVARQDHKHNIVTAAPVTIGVANGAGSGGALALANHVHDHGALLGGDRHAPATALLAGFQSAADFTKLASTSAGNSAQSTGAAPVTIATIAVPLNSTLSIRAEVSGDRDDFSQSGMYAIRGGFRNTAGVVSLVGAVVDTFISEDDGTWIGPDLIVSGTNVLLVSSAKAAVTANWVADYSTRSA